MRYPNDMKPPFALVLFILAVFCFTNTQAHDLDFRIYLRFGRSYLQETTRPQSKDTVALSGIRHQETRLTGESPDGNLQITVTDRGGYPAYAVTFNGKEVLKDSPLGLLTNVGDFTTGMQLKDSANSKHISETYRLNKIKQSTVHYEANEVVFAFLKDDLPAFDLIFRISNNDIAFRYMVHAQGDRLSTVIQQERSGFRFPADTHSFLSPMMIPMTGFARTAPSYESGYEVDVSMEENKAAGGYVFPGLFRTPSGVWALVSETGVRSLYPGSHLSSYDSGTYYVDYPDPRQNNGFGSSGALIGLPGKTPWRTITVGQSLKPIAETTIPFDVVKPLYQSSTPYTFGRGTWSWIIWQDDSMNYADQVKYIDLAAEMGFEYILIDAWWDERIGYDKMQQLIDYAASKNVAVFLWYNSNGIVNDAFMTPRDKMNTSIARKKEMKWLQKAGVKGIKVDFFGGDKQETMRLYEDILSDANDYGLMVVFHGATLPRGWERMYPNFVGSEAVLASEMLVFVEDVRKKEAVYASLHPFIRNSVAAMEFGGVVLNKFLNRGNKKGQERLTGEVFQLATSILFQNPIQFFALTPDNPDNSPAWAIDFMKKVPTTWDETVFLDGYPGKYVVLARRHGDRWYIAGVNADGNTRKVTLDLSMLENSSQLKYYRDDHSLQGSVEHVKLKKSRNMDVEIPENGGILITN